MFSPQSEASKLDSTFAFLTSIDRCLGGQYHDLARAGCSRLFYDWAEDYLSKDQPQLSRQAFAYALRGGGVGQIVSGAHLAGSACGSPKRRCFNEPFPHPRHAPS
ncbi:hypothetical protein N8D56_13460 [Devosia sp. A8/3-2]|nr:hypothetical protein N8D56_13460 [Devosia sp. A8/3-2]